MRAFGRAGTILSSFRSSRSGFEQNVVVAERLARHRAGKRMRYAQTSPEQLADAIAGLIRSEASWPAKCPVAEAVPGWHLGLDVAGGANVPERTTIRRHRVL